MNKKALLRALFVLMLSAIPAYSSTTCDQCEDLCRLMDRYLQEEKGIEYWKKFAASTPDEQRLHLAHIKTGPQLEELVMNAFNQWTKKRQLPCQQPEGPNLQDAFPSPTTNPGGSSSVVTELETHFEDSRCRITYKVNGEDKDLDEVKDQFEKDWGCKTLSDALIAHEQVHVEHCMQAYAQGEEAAQKILSDPANIAESELQAWTKHRDVLADQIRNIIRSKGCGWQPTKGQANNMNAIPSVKQSIDMQKRGYKAVDALSKGQP
jgi:hypothetical protein